MAKDDLKNDGIHNLTSMGQFGYVQSTTASTDTTGQTAYVTDADTISYRATAVGGGSATALVFFDGTNWIYH